METSLEVHKWLKIELQYDPSVPLLGIHSENPCPIIRDICAFMCYVSLFMIIRKWNPLRYPSTEWKGNCGVYIHNGIVFNQKEKWNNEIWGKMNGLRKYSKLREVSQTQKAKKKKKHWLFTIFIAKLTCIWNIPAYFKAGISVARL